MGTNKAINLSRQDIIRFWSQSGKPIEDLISSMERCEEWVPDDRFDDEVREAIGKLSAALSSANDEAIVLMIRDNPLLLLRVMAMLHTGQAIVLFRWLSEITPSAVSIMTANNGVKQFSNQDEVYIGLLLERLQNLERMRLLSRIFSAERISIVLETLEAIAKD